MLSCSYRSARQRDGCARGSDGRIAGEQVPDLGGVHGPAGGADLHGAQRLVAGLLVELHHPRGDLGAGIHDRHACCALASHHTQVLIHTDHSVMFDILHA